MAGHIDVETTPYVATCSLHTYVYIPSTNADGDGEQEPMADASAYFAKKPMSDADGSSRYPSLAYMLTAAAVSSIAVWQHYDSSRDCSSSTIAAPVVAVAVPVAITAVPAAVTNNSITSDSIAADCSSSSSITTAVPAASVAL